MLKKWIKDNCYTKSKILNPNLSKKSLWKKKGILDKYQEILKVTNFLPKDVKFKERVYCILNELTEIQKCLICDCPVRFAKVSYYKYCSVKCGSNNYTTKKKKVITSRKNWGVDHPSKNNNIIEKSKKTCRLKWGTEWPQQRHIPKESIKKLHDIDWLIEENKTKSMAGIAKELCISPSAIQHKFLDNNIVPVYHNHSHGEKEVFRYIESILPKICVLNNDRNVIYPLELDIWIPSLNVAIEYNGNYWHEDILSRKRDNKKERICLRKSIQLYWIWESEWIEYREEMKEIMLTIISEHNS